MIEEILLASRLDSPGAAQEPLEEVDLTALAAEECARNGAELGTAGVVVTVVVTRGSPRLLRRLVRNLLENAQRYGKAAHQGSAAGVTSTTAPIEVHVQQANGKIELSVCDRGPGVPEAERGRIFEPFYRLRGAREAEGGAGLGLALVAAIARQHGGSVACTARDGGGACFRVSLPG